MSTKKPSIARGLRCFLGNDLDNGADIGPLKDLFGFIDAHVDAAMAHGGAKIVVPISAMDGIVAIKIHG